MPRFSMLVSSLSFLALAACSSTGGGAATAKPAATVPAASVQADDSRAGLRATCVAMFERARTCTDDYLAMLVDARVRADRPAGIAAADHDQGRDALVAKAHEEWREDSTDASIAAVCDHVVQAPADARIDQMAAAVKGCLAEAECADFARCMAPVTDAQLQLRQ
jgi:hypothetical protein